MHCYLGDSLSVDHGDSEMDYHIVHQPGGTADLQKMLLSPFGKLLRLSSRDFSFAAKNRHQHHQYHHHQFLFLLLHPASIEDVPMLLRVYFSGFRREMAATD